MNKELVNAWSMAIVRFVFSLGITWKLIQIDSVLGSCISLGVLWVIVFCAEKIRGV